MVVSIFWVLAIVHWHWWATHKKKIVVILLTSWSLECRLANGKFVSPYSEPIYFFFFFFTKKNVCRPPMTKTVSRTSVSSRGSPTEENAGPPSGYVHSRGSSISGAPPPIPERSTPGPGSIGRHGSVGSISSDVPEQPTERAPTLSSARRDSQSSNSSRSNAQRPAPPQNQSSVGEDTDDTMKNLRRTFAGIFGDM